MEFWGIEVKPGQTVKCEPGEERVLHLSQASLGESKKEKGSENVPIFVNINSQKLVLGTLSTYKCAQIQYDLVFEKEFELSHGSKDTSVFFVGYRSIYQGFDSEDDFSASDSEEDLPVAKKANLLSNPPKIVAAKAPAEKEASGKADNASAKLKAKVEIKEPIKDNKNKKVEEKDEDVSNDEDGDDDADDDSFEEESDDDEDMIEAPGDDNSSEEDDDESSEEEGTPKKVENSIKRKADSASKTPNPEKKAKLVTPAGNQKTGGDGKKSTHIATPHPAKQGGKPQQTPKSVGNVACKSCSRTFTSENALQSHTKAKHGAAAK
ncbi:histone deacetylase HDT1-like isoform X2 [Phalaenopsis equestris]|uniref:histone deacetylase HDT1-like isoform X2 n=1 Tax=Phalaenopsis equestris TaxID=78828 RepID=UPI0009E602F6|nr:histone deacetylase HDT1-like isoform X2 [Phalaenopsis equestris]